MVQEQAVPKLGPVIPGLKSAGRDPGRLVATVDGSKCTGQGVCIELAAAGFALDRFGYAYVRPGTSDRAVSDPTLRAALRAAEARCPEGAIRIDTVRTPVTLTSRSALPSLSAPPDGSMPGTGSAPSTESRELQPTGSGPVADAGRFEPRLTIDGDGPESLAEWRAKGGFSHGGSSPLREEVERAGLVGHGGAAFPVAAKWQAARGLQPPLVVANGAEREPGAAKDRYLMEHRPFLVLDGLRATALAVGARQVVIGVDEDSTLALARVTGAADEARRQALLDGIEVRVQAVPARYVAGEETALLRALAGEAALPRSKPPYPTQSGLLGRPTIVHNVETLAQIGLIAAHGADWFRRLGTPEEPGTGLFSVSRVGGAPIVVERPSGTAVRQLLDSTGWAAARAVVVGGWSGGLLPADRFDLPLTCRAMADAGVTLGTKSLQVLSDTDCPVRVVATGLGYLAGESAGQCPPCTMGLPYLAEMLATLAAGTLPADALGEGRAFAASLIDRGACRLPDGAVRLLTSLFDHFGEEVDRHLAGGCSASVA